MGNRYHTKHRIALSLTDLVASCIPDIVNGVSFQVDSSSVVGVIDPAGNSHSVLLKTLSSFLPLEDGLIEVYGQDVHSNKLAQKKIKYCPSFNCIKEAKIKNIIELILDNKYLTYSALEQLKKLGIEGAILESRSINVLSAVAFVTTILTIAPGNIIILDRALVDTTLKIQQHACKTIAHHCKKGGVALIGGEDFGWAEKIINEIVILKYGTLIFKGSVQQLQANTGYSSLFDCCLEYYNTFNIDKVVQDAYV